MRSAKPSGTVRPQRRDRRRDPHDVRPLAPIGILNAGMIHHQWISGAILLIAAALPLPAADLRTAVEAYVAPRQPEILGELAALLSIPNVAADRENIRRNAELLQTMLGRRGLAAEILETAGNPLVYGERKVPGAGRLYQGPQGARGLPAAVGSEVVRRVQ